MEFVTNLLQACSSMQLGNAKHSEENNMASEVQLNAFEFRNYRTSLEKTQQRLVERIVNQLCASLVKGKTLMVNGTDERVYMDKDLLGLLHDNELYPLKDMVRMELLRDDDTSLEKPFCLDLEFRVKLPLYREGQHAVVGAWEMRFSFEDEDQRLRFALTLRILRTRDPALDERVRLEVLARDADEYDQVHPAKVFHYNVDTGFPIVFSVSELRITKPIRSTSKLVYVEFFVRYPRQDKFLYAKSPTAPVSQKVLSSEEKDLRKRKEKDEDAHGSQEKGKKDSSVNTAMTFDLKNVKLKIPKVPHTIFGRLMAKDDYFPTAIGTFEFDVKRNFLVDRREGRRDDNAKREPEVLQIPMMSTWKEKPEKDAKEEIQKIGVLTVRVLGYIVDVPRPGSERPMESERPARSVVESEAEGSRAQQSEVEASEEEEYLSEDVEEEEEEE